MTAEELGARYELRYHAPMKNFFLFIIAAVLIVVIGTPVFLFNLLRKRNKADYLYTVAYGIDQLGGSILYGQPSFTVSSYTHFLAARGYADAKRFAAIIDFFFGKDHCKRAYHNELKADIIEAEALLVLHDEKACEQ